MSKWTDRDEHRLLDLASAGNPLDIIADELGRSEIDVAAQLRKIDLAGEYTNIVPEYVKEQVRDANSAERSARKHERTEWEDAVEWVFGEMLDYFLGTDHFHAVEGFAAHLRAKEKRRRQQARNDARIDGRFR